MDVYNGLLEKVENDVQTLSDENDVEHIFVAAQMRALDLAFILVGDHKTCHDDIQIEYYR